MTSAQLATLKSKVTEIVSKMLDSGPDLQDDLTDVKAMVDAFNRIKDRTVKRFGLSGPSAWGSAQPISDDELAQLLEQPSVKTDIKRLNEGLGNSGEGAKGPFVDLLMQLIQLAMTNPQLLALILQLFNKPATT